MDKKQARPKATLDLDGVQYELQHPGNRAWLTHYQETMGGGTTDVVAFLDWCFEHVIFPKKGPKLNLDTLPIGGQQTWIPLLLGFLIRGELEAGRAWSDFEGTGLVIAPGEGEDGGQGGGEKELADMAGGDGKGDDKG